MPSAHSGNMKKFTGFTAKETFTPIPDSFFRQLLAEIDDADELKVTLYALWRIGNMEGRVHFLRAVDFAGVVPDPASGLEKAAQRGTLLEVLPRADSRAGRKGPGTLYFLNSPRGRAAADAFAKGQWEPESAPEAPHAERPNIFRLYEENIGPLTPILADALKDAEQMYPEEWVVEALRIAVLKNKRNWKYVEAILKRWKVEGHAKKQDRSDAQEDGRRYVEGEFADFVEH